MDTTTVLEIIKMLDTKIANHTIAMEEHGVSQDSFAIGVNKGLTIARDHLQSFIEAQVNAEENKSAEQ